MGVLDLSLTVHAHGDAPPDVVWERYADLRRWPQWSPQISGVESTGSSLKSGLTGTVTGPFGIAVPFEIVEVGIRSWAWDVRALGTLLHLDHRVVPRGSGAETALRMRGAAPVVVAYAPFAKLALRRLVTW
ncbi:MAG: hypothetical protein JWO22_3997 [Frankiales bacterium]|nr:hypothetical protein [Frankiales bacterium]